MPAPQGLWVVGTPIGNLEDLTPRALRALQFSAGVLCEDTRRTLKLLSAFEIKKPLVRYDAHARESEIKKILDRILKGESWALVTDAGTPAISDPGTALVQEARKLGITVSPIPGVSALTTFLSIAGQIDSRFCFRGFFPRTESEKEEELKKTSETSLSDFFVWFESPFRIEGTLQKVSTFDPSAEVIVAKELTKIYEKFFHGLAPQVYAEVKEELSSQGNLGEWCLGVQYKLIKECKEKSLDWVKTLECLLNLGVASSVAARQLSQYFGIPKNSVYEMALRLRTQKK